MHDVREIASEPSVVLGPDGPPCAFFLPRCLVAVAPGQAERQRGRWEQVGGRPKRKERPRERETPRKRDREREGEQRCPDRADGLPQSTFGSSTSAALVNFRRDTHPPALVGGLHLHVHCLPTARCPCPRHGPRGYCLQIGISGGMRGLGRLITDTCRFWANVGHKIPGHWSKLFRGGIPKWSLRARQSVARVGGRAAGRQPDRQAWPDFTQNPTELGLRITHKR